MEGRLAEIPGRSPLMMNSKDKNRKAPAAKKGKILFLFLITKPFNYLVMSLMTPRNLAPATPMRFSSATESATKTPSLTGRVIKGSQTSGKDKSPIPLPPGYVDRAAQRRSGLETTSTLNIFDTETATGAANSSSDPMKIKLEFLRETVGIDEFPNCSQIQTERLMKLVLGSGSGDEVINKFQTSDFKDNEAFLQFKSIEESKTQPFDPFNRPRKVFRASSGTKEKVLELEDDFVIERVKAAVKRLEIASGRHEKYLKTLTQNSVKAVGDDIFPEVGIFDEKSALENGINYKTEANFGNGKVKAKNRLFATKSVPKAIEKEFDVFELIARKSLEEENNKKSLKESDSGGLFGFSNMLPKLSRLESENNIKGTETKLTGAYASILLDNDDEAEVDENRSNFVKNETEEYADDYLYPGYLENDPAIFDSDEEIIENDVGKMPKNKRKLARKEDKEAAKVEKLVKTKFGVDLSK